MKNIFILLFLFNTIQSQKTYDPYINVTFPEKSNDFILLKIIPKLNDSSTYT